MANRSCCNFSTRKKLSRFSHSLLITYIILLFLPAVRAKRVAHTKPKSLSSNITHDDAPTAPHSIAIPGPLGKNITVNFGFDSTQNVIITNATKPRRFVLVYSAESVNRMVQNYHARTSTNDPVHEDYYTRSRLGDNVFYNIERLVPFKTFVGWMANTTKITDRFDPTQDKSLISDYITKPGVACAPQSAFQLSDEVIMTDDVSQRVQLGSKLSAWFDANENTPVEEMCNRFNGLQCSPSRNVCECESERMHFVSYTKAAQGTKVLYRDSCYVKAWKRCNHLSLDTSIRSEYKAFHAHPSNMKQFLMRLATPMPKMARCERGSYCVDLVLNKKKPICWCQSRQYSKVCYNSTMPLLDKFLSVRNSFHKMMILEKDRDTRCTVDEGLESHLSMIQSLSEDPESNFYQIMTSMKEVLLSRSKGTRFCDFRKGLACDPYKGTCTYKYGCGPGRVMETLSDKRKVCRVNNGYPCTTLELKCIRGAECKDFGKGKHCHCIHGRFGDLCKFEAPTFFGTLLQSRVSGFVGFHFMNMQEVVSLALLPLERLMTLGYGDKCDPSLDAFAMTVIKYLGNVRNVVLQKMDLVLGSVQKLVGKNEPLCDYKRFLGCSLFSRQCEPMIPDVAKYESEKGVDRFTRGVNGQMTTAGKIIITLKDKAMCVGPGNNSQVPVIYEDIVHVQCMPHHVCRALDGKREAKQFHSTSDDAMYCLCPVGKQGVGCEEKLPSKFTRIDVYQLPAPVLVESSVKSVKYLPRHISIMKS